MVIKGTTPAQSLNNVAWKLLEQCLQATVTHSHHRHHTGTAVFHVHHHYADIQSDFNAMGKSFALQPLALQWGCAVSCAQRAMYAGVSAKTTALALVLAQTCRLRELHAAGNSIEAPPAHLAPFTSLTLLNLQHNHLQLAHLEVFAQLPVLQHLDVSHNSLNGPPPRVEGDMASHGGASCGSFDSLQVLNISSSRVKQLQAVQELLSRMRSLILLQMTHTPLADRCRSGKLHVQVGMMVLLS